jgi:hypothetical protein
MISVFAYTLIHTVSFAVNKKRAEGCQAAEKAYESEGRA